MSTTPIKPPIRHSKTGPVKPENITTSTSGNTSTTGNESIPVVISTPTITTTDFTGTSFPSPTYMTGTGAVLDPFIYSTMTLDMPSPSTQLTNLLNSVQTAITPADFDSILSGTTVKRACCMGSGTSPNVIPISSIPVKMPIPVNPAPSSTVLNANPLYNKYGYMEKLVKVPSDLCGNYSPGSQSCNDFMDVYCANVKNDYINLNNGQFNASDWNSYSPECACYGQTLTDMAKTTGTPSLFGGLTNVAPMFYMPGCAAGISYLDPASRLNPSFDPTICSSIISLANSTSKGSINISDNTSSCSQSVSKDSTVVTEKDNSNTSSSDTTSNTSINNTSNTIMTPNTTNPSPSSSSPLSSPPSPPPSSPSVDATGSSLLTTYLLGSGSVFSSLCCILIVILAIIFYIKFKK
jgi:hypothetical protein